MATLLPTPPTRTGEGLSAVVCSCSTKFGAQLGQAAHLAWILLNTGLPAYCHRPPTSLLLTPMPAVVPAESAAPWARIARAPSAHAIAVSIAGSRQTCVARGECAAVARFSAITLCCLTLPLPDRPCRQVPLHDPGPVDGEWPVAGMRELSALQLQRADHSPPSNPACSASRLGHGAMEASLTGSALTR